MTLQSKRPSRLYRVFSTCAVLLVTMMIGTAVEAADKVKFLLDWTWWPPQIPLIVAQEKGFYSGAGLDVEMKQGSGSGTTAQLIGQGTYEIGNVDLTVAAQAITKGASMKAVANTAPKGAQGIIFKKGSIKSVQDIKGRQIGSSPGDSGTQMFPAFLSANGLTPNDITMAFMPGEAKLTALLTDKVPVIIGDGNYYVALAAAKGIELDWMSFADNGALLLGYGLVAHESQIKNRPEVIRRFVDATGEGFAYARSNIDESIDIYNRVSGLKQDPDLVRRILVGFFRLTESDETKGKPFGWNGTKNWTSTLDILVKYGNLGKPLSHEDYYTNEFLRR